MVCHKVRLYLICQFLKERPFCILFKNRSSRAPYEIIRSGKYWHRMPSSNNVSITCINIWDLSTCLLRSLPFKGQSGSVTIMGNHIA